MNPSEFYQPQQEIFRVLGEYQRAQRGNLNLPHLLTNELTVFTEKQWLVERFLTNGIGDLNSLMRQISANGKISPSKLNKCIQEMDRIHSVMHGVPALQLLFPDIYGDNLRNSGIGTALEEFKSAYHETLCTFYLLYRVTHQIAKLTLVLSGRQLVDHYLCSIQNLPPEFDWDVKITPSRCCTLPFALATNSAEFFAGLTMS